MISMHKALAVSQRPGVVLDVGANKGQFANRAMSSGHIVYAFEPHPVYYYALLLRSGWSFIRSIVKPGRLFVCRVGLSDDSKETILYLHPTLPGSHSIIPGKVEEDRVIGTRINNDGKHYTIQTVTLDSWALPRKDFKIGFIKVDIEGAETAFLNGGLETIRRDLPDVFIEVRGNPNSVCGETIREVFSLLLPLGYHFYYDDVLALDLVSKKLICAVVQGSRELTINYSPPFLHGDIFFSQNQHNDHLLKE